jgi:Ni/Fe-hydrogenase subunit HybB-like protein
MASFIFTYLGKKEYLPLAKFSALAVMALWAVAPILLLFDIGQPLRFWHIFAYFEPRSPIAWGTVILTLYPVLASIYVFHLFRENLEKARFWGFVGLPVALGSHAFAGFVLSFAHARVLWSSSMIPIFFLLTAALSGLALVVIFDTIRYAFFLNRTPGAQARETPIFHQLGTALYFLIFADLGLILSYLVKLGTSPELFSQVVDLMAGGKMGAAELLHCPLDCRPRGSSFPALFPRTGFLPHPWVQCAASFLIVRETSPPSGPRALRRSGLPLI